MPKPARSYRNITFGRHPILTRRVSHFYISVISATNSYIARIDKGPTSRPSNTIFISYPSGIRASICEDCGRRLELMDKVEPIIKIILHILLTLTFCTIQEHFFNLTISCKQLSHLPQIEFIVPNSVAINRLMFIPR
nr:hypothetical protein Iba_scaffold53638CG0050 [Ipomoea batatas]